MNIFNETLEFNPIEECKDSKKLYIYVAILTIFTLIALLLFFIIKNELLNSTLSCIGMSFLVFILYDDMKQPNNSNSNNKKTINPSNPLSKLYPTINEQVCLDLSNLWQIYNTTYRKNKPLIINSISFNYEIINTINSLFKKLNYELVNMLEKYDENTLKLLNLEDIDSYKKLYMLIIAPQEVEDIKYEIKKMHKKLMDNKNFYLLENLTQIEQEVDKKHLDENCYFEYKKWHKTIKEQLENINNEKYIDEKTKQNYNQIIKDMNK